MAQIVTITNPLTGQPAQVDQLDHTAQEIDDAIARALPGGDIDTLLARKAPSTYLGNISRNKIYKIGYFFKGSGASSSGAVTIRIRNFNDYGKENYMLAFLGAYGFSIEYHGQITTTYTSKISVYSDPSVTGSAKKYTVFVTTQDYVDWASVYIDNEHSFTRNFADVTDTFSALVDGLDKVWESEYEYLNPPMQLGVEYRTTERYMGKPVYTMAFSTGNLRAAGVKAVITKSTDQNGNALSPHYLVSCFGVINQEASAADGRYVIPTMSYGGGIGDDGIVRVMAACSSTVGIQLIVYAPARDLSSKSAVFTVKYTKTKDD